MCREIDNATPARRTPILKNICERMFLMYNFLITINLKDRLKPTQKGREAKPMLGCKRKR